MNCGRAHDNVVFFYVPCLVKNGSKAIQTAKKALVDSASWKRENLHTHKFYRFITNKLKVSTDNPGCSLFRLKENASNHSFILENKWSIVDPKTTGNEPVQVLDFKIENVYLVLFDTAVFFFVFQVSFLNPEHSMRKMANSLYFLKKPAEIKISTKIHNKQKKKQLVDIVKEIIGVSFEKYSIEYEVFFYLDEKYARSNYLLMTKAPGNISEDELHQSLYFLRNGFSDRYKVVNDNCQDYNGPNGRHWGITSESSVCIIEDSTNFLVENKQFAEFKTEYFIIYTLLLFQKYTYFYLLNVLSCLNYGKKKELKKYKELLSDFERDYVFSVITDIPQYKEVYELIVEKLNLARLSNDVQVPIKELDDRTQASHERRIEAIGFLFSVLGVFSIIVDGNQVFQMFSGLNIVNEVSKIISFDFGIGLLRNDFIKTGALLTLGLIFVVVLRKLFKK